jgi:hypothetical protein
MIDAESKMSEEEFAREFQIPPRARKCFEDHAAEQSAMPAALFTAMLTTNIASECVFDAAPTSPAAAAAAAAAAALKKAAWGPVADPMSMEPCKSGARSLAIPFFCFILGMAVAGGMGICIWIRR